MSELSVGQFKGLPVNNNVITVPSGETLYAPGHVIQVQSVTKTDTSNTTSTSFFDVSGLSVSITPKSASSKILVTAHFMLGSNTTSAGTRINLVRGSTNIAQTTAGTALQTINAYTASSASGDLSGFTFFDSPNTTSATTYKIQFATGGSGTSYVGTYGLGVFGTSISSITVMEIAQ
jgi:hypothetical protein